MVEVEEREDIVETLIDNNTQWQNIDKLELNLSEVAEILKIIICPQTNKDKWIWIQEINDSQSVKSAYILFRDKLKKNKGESYSANIHKSL